MAYPQKIATCCYCGTRAALVLKGRTRQELSCSNCGAPLHNLKMMPVVRHKDRDPVERKRGKLRPKNEVRSAKGFKPINYAKPKKRRKGLLRHIFEEAFELIEDVFD